ncbi:MAG: hypothetical protein JWL75_175 [Parcubacteria group bacterium]|nr:hypothetical protein [Parcubacteria group bacterium]
MYQLSVKECLSTGWRTFTSRPWLFIVAGALLFAISAIADIPRAVSKGHEGAEGVALWIITFLISSIVSFLVSMGKTAFYLKSHDAAESAKLADLWHPKPFLKYAIVTILSGLATFIGLILLIVPGIIVGIMFGFSQYLVIEKHLSPMEALRESARLTHGNRWNLFLLGLALLGINILGFCALFVGLLVTLPISTIAVIHAYRLLSSTAASEPVPASVSASTDAVSEAAVE